MLCPLWLLLWCALGAETGDVVNHEGPQQELEDEPVKNHQPAEDDPSTSKVQSTTEDETKYLWSSTPETSLAATLQQFCMGADLGLRTEIKEPAPLLIVWGSVTEILDALCGGRYVWHIKNKVVYVNHALTTEVYLVSIPATKNAVWDEVRNTVKSIYSNCSINQTSGLVVATGLATQHTQMRSYLKALLGAVNSQVCISVTLIRIVRTDARGGGLDINDLWARFANHASLSLSSQGLILKMTSADDVSSICKVFEEYGRVKSVSTALLSAVNNQPACLQVNKRLAYFKQVYQGHKTKSAIPSTEVINENVGTVLEVCPTIRPDSVLLDINFSIRAHAGNKINPAMLALAHKEKYDNAFLEGSKVPEIDTQSMKTGVVLADNEGVLLSVFQRAKQKQSSAGIPFLSRIPLIGGLFGRTKLRNEKEEVYVYIRMLDRSAQSKVGKSRKADGLCQRRVRVPKEKCRKFKRRQGCAVPIPSQS